MHRMATLSISICNYFCLHRQQVLGDTQRRAPRMRGRKRGAGTADRVDQIEQRPPLLAQRMDDVMVVDDVAVAYRWLVAADHASNSPTDERPTMRRLASGSRRAAASSYSVPSRLIAARSGAAWSRESGRAGLRIGIIAPQRHQMPGTSR